MAKIKQLLLGSDSTKDIWIYLRRKLIYTICIIISKIDTIKYIKKIAAPYYAPYHLREMLWGP